MPLPPPAARSAASNLREPFRLVWLSGASCEGCTMAMLGATEPGLEDLLRHTFPDLPQISLVHPVLSLESGDSYLELLEQAVAGRYTRLILVLEGSVMDEARAGEGSFSRLGEGADGRPVTTSDWIDRLAPLAEAIVAIGSCATSGGIPAAAANPTGAMGLEDYLGAEFRSRAGLPVLNMPGCAPSGEAFVEFLISIFRHLEGFVPLELDEERRPRWLYAQQTHPMPPRAAYLRPEAYEVTGAVAVGCPVPTQGWMRGIGGCARVGGACIGCTARGFVDHHLEFARPHHPV